MSFSFADVYAREVRQRLEQEKPAERPPAHPAEANENLSQAVRDERRDTSSIFKNRKSLTR